MAHFLGEVRGNRGPATRVGSKANGIRVTAASWHGAVEVSLSYDEKTGQDVAEVSLRPWHGSGTSKLLYEGPVSGIKRSVQELALLKKTGQGA